MRRRCSDLVNALTITMRSSAVRSDGVRVVGFVRHRSGAMRVTALFWAGLRKNSRIGGNSRRGAAIPNARSRLRRSPGDCSASVRLARAKHGAGISCASNLELFAHGRATPRQRHGVSARRRRAKPCTCAKARTCRSFELPCFSPNEPKAPARRWLQNVTSTCAPPSNHIGTGSGLNTTPACRPTFRCGMMVRSSRRPASPVKPVSSWSLPYQPCPRCA